MSFIIATDASSHRELWRQRIYTITVHRAREHDVQDVFITSLARRGQRLTITNESGERFALDLPSRKVTRVSDRNT
jgi:hypothetical protein